jgi:hypothetical protein
MSQKKEGILKYRVERNSLEIPLIFSLAFLCSLEGTLAKSPQGEFGQKKESSFLDEIFH